MESLIELIKVLGGIGEIAPIVAIGAFGIWLVSRFLDQQENQQILFSEQNDRSFNTITEYTEKIAKLIILVEQNLEKSEKLGDEIDSLREEILQELKELNQLVNQYHNSNNKKK